MLIMTIAIPVDHAELEDAVQDVGAAVARWRGEVLQSHKLDAADGDLDATECSPRYFG